jgi:putative heme-binding domain-containing protein
MIGKKYERASLLETILNPSKAIAPEYVPYLVATESGQVHAGFRVETTDNHVLLQDENNKQIRIAADEIAGMRQQEKSLMPELVLRDVTAQDAADLLAFLMSLNKATLAATSINVLGPFESPLDALDKPLDPEKKLDNPDLGARYLGLENRESAWEALSADNVAGHAHFDTVKYDRERKLRSDAVAHYFLTYVDSGVEQDADLLLGSDDACKVWLNGREIHRNFITRGLRFANDRVSCHLRQGKNVLIVKVVNGNGAGGLCLAVEASGPVDFKVR